MANLTQKHINFVSEPMRNKSVRKVPGVGTVLGTQLAEAGFARAYNVLGKFLTLNKDRRLFQLWMRESFNANERQSGLCYECLRDWCDEFL